MDQSCDVKMDGFDKVIQDLISSNWVPIDPRHKTILPFEERGNVIY